MHNNSHWYELPKKNKSNDVECLQHILQTKDLYTRIHRCLYQNFCCKQKAIVIVKVNFFSGQRLRDNNCLLLYWFIEWNVVKCGTPRQPVKQRHRGKFKFWNLLLCGNEFLTPFLSISGYISWNPVKRCVINLTEWSLRCTNLLIPTAVMVYTLVNRVGLLISMINRRIILTLISTRKSWSTGLLVVKRKRARKFMLQKFTVSQVCFC